MFVDGLHEPGAVLRHRTDTAWSTDAQSREYPHLRAGGRHHQFGHQHRRKGGGRLVLDVTGADAEWKRLIRRMVRVNDRGSVQAAFGA